MSSLRVTDSWRASVNQRRSRDCGVSQRLLTGAAWAAAVRVRPIERPFQEVFFCSSAVSRPPRVRADFCTKSLRRGGPHDPCRGPAYSFSPVRRGPRDAECTNSLELKHTRGRCISRLCDRRQAGSEHEQAQEPRDPGRIAQRQLDPGADESPDHRPKGSTACRRRREGSVGMRGQERKETCTCGDPPLHDFHIWMVDQSGQARASAAVVEMTPRWRAANPGWTLSALQHLINQKSRVRVTGWRYLDPNHQDQVGHTRASRWEIHPITKIEVANAGGWTEL